MNKEIFFYLWQAHLLSPSTGGGFRYDFDKTIFKDYQHLFGRQEVFPPPAPTLGSQGQGKVLKERHCILYNQD